MIIKIIILIMMMKIMKIILISAVIKIAIISKLMTMMIGIMFSLPLNQMVRISCR